MGNGHWGIFYLWLVAIAASKNEKSSKVFNWSLD